MEKKIFAGLALLLSFAGYAQPASKFSGTWEGTLNVGTQLRIVFHIQEKPGGTLWASADSPDQSAYGLKCDTSFINNNGITIEMHALRASFTGKLTSDTTIDGTFTQGIELPLSLKKVEQPAERKRPQTPEPPFPYKSQEVEYDNAKTKLHYGATITIPQGKGPFPAAVLITGSGQQTRDEELFGHRLFAVIADHLTRKGFIVLRVDDRGIGKSTGNFKEATSADFAQDVHASVDYLLSRPEVDKKKLGLIGHSEGGMIAPVVATQRKDINFIVLLAGPGVPIMDLMAEQNAAILRSAGIKEEAIAVYTPLYRQMMQTIASGRTAMNDILPLVNEWLNKTDSSLVRALDLHQKENQQNMVATMVETMATPWFRYFISFVPANYLEKLNAKVLAINGARDLQVVAAQNLPGIEAALKKSKAKDYKVEAIDGLNHLFQTCKKCTLEEYAELEETFSPVALQIISDWLEKHVK